MDKIRIKELLHLLASGNAIEEERQELYMLYGRPENEALIKDLIEEYWNSDSFKTFLTEEESKNLYHSIAAQLVNSSKPRKIIKVKQWLVAASLLGIVAVSWWLIDKKTAEPVKTTQNAPLFHDDVSAPKASKAHILTQSGVVKKLPGKADVKLADGEERGGESYTLVNPRGSIPVSITLADGTQAWLNAESSIKYPAVFNGGERKVVVTGEVYFEVSPDKSKPFIVHSGKAEVKVLGTHFNVNSFNDKVKVTLLEGKVNVSSNSESNTLSPGQTAIVDQFIQVMPVDTEVAMAWKHDVFNFSQTPLTEVMEEVGRWYDVGISYQGKVPNMTLSGIVNRSDNISKVLELLEMSSGLTYKLDGKKVTISKK